MDQNERDLWAWAELFVTLLSGVAIPLVLGYFSYQFRSDQLRAQNTDRIRNSVELLASESWRERTMGVRLMWHYCHDTRQYPEPLIASFIRTMRTDPDPNVYREAARLFGTASASTACHVQFEGRSDSFSGKRIHQFAPERDLSDQKRIRAQLYVHIQKKEQRLHARQIAEAVDSLLSFTHLRLDVLPFKQPRDGPSQSELRYFDPRQTSQAVMITRAAQQAGLSDLKIRDVSTRYDTIPNHFELWLAPSSFPN